MEISKLFKSRWNLHKDCYNHQTIQAYEVMICDVFMLMNGHLYDFEKIIYDMQKYQQLDDSILDDIRWEAE